MDSHDYIFDFIMPINVSGRRKNNQTANPSLCVKEEEERDIYSLSLILEMMDIKLSSIKSMLFGESWSTDNGACTVLYSMYFTIYHTCIRLLYCSPSNDDIIPYFYSLSLVTVPVELLY